MAYIRTNVEHINNTAVSNMPVEISTATEMDVAQTENNIGRFYKYTGETTSDYVHGCIYQVLDSNTTNNGE